MGGNVQSLSKKNIVAKNIFWENIFLKNVFGKNIFGTSIFFLERDLTFPAIPPQHTTPTPSYLLFEVEGGGGQTKDGLTDRTDAMIVPFIVLDV